MTYSGQEFASPQEALAHYGVKGMRWGVRNNDRPAGVSAKTAKEAKKDAEEYARAKMFYGKGAGTRRKLIKNTVDAKSKKDPSYKKAFDHYLDKQDMSQHASKARSERHRKDVTETTTKTVKGAHRSLTGGFGNVTLSAAILAGAYSLARQQGADQYVSDRIKTSYNDRARRKNSQREAERFLRDMGMK